MSYHTGLFFVQKYCTFVNQVAQSKDWFKNVYLLIHIHKIAFCASPSAIQLAMVWATPHEQGFRSYRTPTK
ncbi:MAG: hypothetical protein U1E99_08850 [Agitococcus sp.]